MDNSPDVPVLVTDCPSSTMSGSSPEAATTSLPLESQPAQADVGQPDGSGPPAETADAPPVPELGQAPGADDISSSTQSSTPISKAPSESFAAADPVADTAMRSRRTRSVALPAPEAMLGRLSNLVAQHALGLISVQEAQCQASLIDKYLRHIRPAVKSDNAGTGTTAIAGGSGGDLGRLVEKLRNNPLLLDDLEPLLSEQQYELITRLLGLQP